MNTRLAEKKGLPGGVTADNNPPVKSPSALGITFGNATNFTVNFHLGSSVLM